MNRFPPRKILVAYDFSKKSRQAWRYAEMLARLFGARLQALHVSAWTVAPEGIFIAPDMSREERRSLQARLDKELGAPGIGRLAEGDIVAEILRSARDLDVDMIVMATEGRTGLRRLALGSLTEAVVRRSPIPVLALHGAAQPPDSILAPVSLDEYSIAGFHFAEDLARALKLPITMLHVRQDDRPLDRLEFAADAARKLWDLRVDLEVSSGAPVRRIVEAARKHGLVVLVAHRRGLLRESLLGTTAERVLRRSRTPVLCVPALRREPASSRRAARRPGARAAGSRRAGLGARLPIGW